MDPQPSQVIDTCQPSHLSLTQNLISAGNPTASPTVSWQTIYWTFVPLVISTMTQPSGRVCGQPSRYRTYLRASPFVCIADCLSILLSFIMYCICTPLFSETSFKDGLRYLMHERFGGLNEEEEQTEGINNLQSMTWLRWLFFAFGTLEPGIKLMAMGGIPFTKTCGAFFLASFVSVELLVIISWYLDLRDTPYQDLMVPHGAFKAISSGLFGIACTCHVLWLLWLWKFFAPLKWIHSFFPYQFFIGTVSHFAEYLAFGAGRAFEIILYFWWVIMLDTDGFLRRVGLGTLLFAFLAAAVSVLARSGLLVWIILSAILLFEFIVPSIFLAFVLRYLVKRFLRLGTNLQICFIYPNQIRLELDARALRYLIVFLYSLVFFTFYYGSIYSAKGTSLPAWTGIFG